MGSAPRPQRTRQGGVTHRKASTLFLSSLRAALQCCRAALGSPAWRHAAAASSDSCRLAMAAADCCARLQKRGSSSVLARRYSLWCMSDRLCTSCMCDQGARYGLWANFRVMPDTARLAARGWLAICDDCSNTHPISTPKSRLDTSQAPWGRAAASRRTSSQLPSSRWHTTPPWAPPTR